MTIEQPKPQEVRLCQRCGAESPAEEQFCSRCAEPFSTFLFYGYWTPVKHYGYSTSAKVALLVVVFAIVVAGVLASTFVAGSMGGPNLASARKAGVLAGQRAGAASGRSTGARAGYSAGTHAGYHHTYSGAYHVAYQKAFGQ